MLGFDNNISSKKKNKDNNKKNIQKNNDNNNKNTTTKTRTTSPSPRPKTGVWQYFSHCLPNFDLIRTRTKEHGQQQQKTNEKNQ